MRPKGGPVVYERAALRSGGPAPAGLVSGNIFAVFRVVGTVSTLLRLRAHPRRFLFDID
ncbi:hypothetical protein LCGC14_1126580 [marine sediment metagenome]|uniref:Uncharacterized protein n=1 Tax=marine sediment metagenome TaxID=412755 RepID=A0A0F9M2F4_9ZZZZ